MYGGDGPGDGGEGGVGGVGVGVGGLGGVGVGGVGGAGVGGAGVGTGVDGQSEFDVQACQGSLCIPFREYPWLLSPWGPGPPWEGPAGSTSRLV